MTDEKGTPTSNAVTVNLGRIAAATVFLLDGDSRHRGFLRGSWTPLSPGMKTARPGDLVFRYQGESGFSKAVSTVVRGWGGLAIDHVGLSTGDGWVWEAGHEWVRRVNLESWEGGLLLGRLSEETRSRPGLVDAVVSWIERQKGLPYNATFDQEKTSFYCSELVIDAFRSAGFPLFQETSLTFKDPRSGLTRPTSRCPRTFRSSF